MLFPNEFVFWGSAGHAKVLAEILRLQGRRVTALFDNSAQAISSLSGVPIFIGEDGFHQWQKRQSSIQTLGAAVAIGGDRGKDRHALVQKLRSAGLVLPPLIHPSSIVAATSLVGSASHILAGTVVAADVTLGEACIVNNSANVDHECRIGNGVHIAPGAVICGCVVIGDYAMVGAGAVILPRVRIGAEAIVGAGAVVTHDVQPGITVVGNPARPV